MPRPSHYGLTELCLEAAPAGLIANTRCCLICLDPLAHGLDLAQDSVVWGAAGEVGVYLDGNNGAPLAAARWNARGGTLLDGAAHHVRVTYTAVAGQSWLHLFLDHETFPAFGLPLSLSDAGMLDEAGMAWVGFTASTGVASMDADLLSFAFTQYPGE